MVNKVEHHVSNQKQIDKLKNITEKSIYIALEEKGILFECYLLNKDFKKTFKWAEMYNNNLLLALHYYFGLGVQKDNQKCAHHLLREDKYIKRLGLNEDGIKKCEANAKDDTPLKESLYQILKFQNRTELWNIFKNSN